MYTNWAAATLTNNFDKAIHTIPQAFYNSQANFGTHSANMYKEDGKWITISYNELLSKVENLSMGLIKLGLQTDELIGIKAKTSVRWTWADLACLFAGMSTVSFYPSLSQKETITIGNHSQISAMFVDTAQSLYDIIKYMNDIPSIKYLICMEKGFKGNGKNIFGMGEIMYSGSQSRNELLPKMKSRIENLNANSQATMVYTSGTTGNFKGAMLTHKEVLYSCTRSVIHYYKYNRIVTCDGVHMCMVPLSHVMEKIHSYYTPLLLGSTVAFAESPATMMNDLGIVHPTWMMFVPRLLSRFLQGFKNAFYKTEEGKKTWDWAMDVAIRATYALEDEHGNIDITTPYEQQLSGELREEWIKAYNNVFWRFHHAMGGKLITINSGGAYFDPDMQRILVGIGLFIGNGYGLTETGAAILECPPGATKIGWISPPNPGIEILLDDDGEVLMRGHGIITSYYKNDEANKESFTEDGWFRSGDIGELSDDGYLRIVDRKKSLIILDTGENVAVNKIDGLCGNTALLDQSVILGQDKKYIAAMIVPNFEAICNGLRSEGIPFDESQVKYETDINGMRVCMEVGTDVVNNEYVLKAIQADIDKVNQQLESYEEIKAFKLLNRRLNEEAGELTPTGKNKMKYISEKYKDIINSLYQ